MQLSEMQTEVKLRYIGIDSGKARCGVAVSDLSATLASPLAVLSTEPRSTLPERLLSLLTDYAPYELVLGLPLDQRGAHGPAANFATQMGEELGTALACMVHYQDERFSTGSAQAFRRDAGKKGSKLKKDIDSAAAAVILQAFLDRRAMQG
jgi:putative holliday junction resolvase